MAKPQEVKYNEDKWRAEDDARVLQAYMEVISDKTRKKRALRELEEQKKRIEQAMKLKK